MDFLGLATPEWLFSKLSFHIINKIYVSFNSILLIFYYTLHTHTVKLDVNLFFN